MSSSARGRVPILLWPFYAIWRLLSFVLSVTGRLLAGLLGLVLMIVGLVVSATVVGAPLGIPIAVVGFLLLLRSIF